MIWMTLRFQSGLETHMAQTESTRIRISSQNVKIAWPLQIWNEPIKSFLHDKQIYIYMYTGCFLKVYTKYYILFIA